VDFQEITAMTLGSVIGTVILGRELCINSTAGMAIQTKGLVMAVGTVLLPRIGQQPMAARPVGVMIGGNPLVLMATVAVGNLQICIIFMGSLFLGNSQLYE
jgi:hypothetical protein